MKIQNSNIILVLIILTFFVFGCRLGNIKAENKTQEKPKQIETEPKNEEKENQTNSQSDSPSTVVGNYDYDTEKDGEGYDNSLEVTEAGKGKLFIYISGNYIYKIGETQTFKETEGKGEAVLKGNRAAVTLVDEAGNPCRATITFKNDSADVKIPDTCQFNIALSGFYKKASSKVEKNKVAESGKINTVSYEKMMDLINDFEVHKVGEEFIITGVPSEILNQKNPADEFGNKSYKNLYYLQGVTNDDMPSYSVLTSKAIIESLNKNAGYEPVILQMTAINVESKGKFDVYRMPFVTKIEGLNSDGDVIWTAIGAKPAKLYYTH